MKFALFALAGIVALWVLGDFLYARVVAWRMARWEATIERGPDGVRRGCEDFTLGQGDTALLLIHGINDSPAVFRKMAPRLAAAGFTCRAMRLPGFAMPLDAYRATTRRQWIEAIGREADALHKTHARVVLVAHSLGGAAAIGYLLEHPQGAERCALIAPCLAVSDARSPAFSTRTWHAVGSRVLYFTRVTETPFPNDAHDPAEQNYASRTRFCPREVVTELFHLVDEIDRRAGEFRTPLLMVLSKDDRVIDWEAAHRFFEQAASPEKRLVFVADAGHAIPVDYGWEEVADAIAAFARPAPETATATATREQR